MTEQRQGLAVWGDLLAADRAPRFALICLGVWLNAADALVTATIMPSVGADLGGYALFSWSVAGFLLGAILAGASAGRVSEILGLRPATVSAGLVLAAGCVLSAVASSMEWFLLGRFVQGFGSGWVSGLAMVAIAFLFPERHLGRVFAAAAAVWGLATILGPLLGGLLAQAGGWRTVFWLFAVQAVLFSGAACVLLPREAASAAPARVPWRQLGLLCIAILVLGGADISQRAEVALAFVGLCLALLVWMLRIDGRARHRLLPRAAGDLGAVPGAGYAAMFLLTATSVGFLIYAPPLLQQMHGLTPLASGYAVAAHAMGWTVAAFVVAGASHAAGVRWIRAGALCILCGAGLLAVLMRLAPVPLIVGAAVIMGMGFGLCSALMNRRVLMALPDDDRATGSSALIAVRQAGEAVGAAIVGVVANLAGFGAGLTPVSAQSTALWVFVAALPVGALGALAAWRMTQLPAVPVTQEQRVAQE